MKKMFMMAMCTVLALAGGLASRAEGAVHGGPPIGTYSDMPACPANQCCVSQGGCCYATAGSCTGDSTCKCTKSCGPGISTCSCQCENSRSQGGDTSNRTSAGAWGDVQVRADGSTFATLQRFAQVIEETTGWKVVFPVDSKGLLLSGEWRGAFEDVVTDVALSVGFTVTMDGKATTITLSR